MAIVVVFGLLVATFLTLVVVPTLYSFFDDLKSMRRRAFSRIEQVAAGAVRVADTVKVKAGRK